MTLLDRFRAQPRDKHADPAVRLAYVEKLPIDDRDALVAFARGDEDPRVRKAAVGKLMDPPALAAVAREESDEGVRSMAIEMLRDIALEAFEGVGEAESLAALEALSDARMLAHVARTTTREAVARTALARVSDARAIGSIARHAGLESIRQAALDRLQITEEIVAVAVKSEFRDTALAALDRLTERADLDQVAARAKNKSAARRARTLLHELDERAAAEHAAPAANSREANVIEIEAEPAPTPSVIAQPTPPPTLEEIRSAEDARVEDDDAYRLSEEQLAARASEEEAARARTREAATDDEKKMERRRLRMVELADEAALAAEDPDLGAAHRRVVLVRREWKDLIAGTGPDASLSARLADAEARLNARDAAHLEAEARARRETLTRLQQLAARLEPLAIKPDLTLKSGERGLRDIKAALTETPQLHARRDYEDVLRRLKSVQAALTPKVKELRDAEDWRRFANLGIQEQLCARMEALRALTDPEDIVRQIRSLQQQWRQAADVPHTQGEALWRRFKGAHDELWARCEAQFAEQAAARADNLAKKRELCERVEALADSTRWIQTAEAIKVLQAEWKTIGPVTRGQEKAIWERFRAACDRFFTRRHADLVERKAAWAANFAKKEALAIQAEALAESTDWEAAGAEIRRLQAEWRTIGPVKKSRSEAIWQRFRAACDKFFARYAQRHDIARGERVAAREAICVELERLASRDETDPAASAELVANVRALRSRWQQELALRGVDRGHAAALDERFRQAFDAVIRRWQSAFEHTDLDPDANRRRMEAIVKRVEALAASLAGPSGLDEGTMSPTTRLAAMLKEALAANTIGGKVDEDGRWRAALEEVRRAQANWSRIGHVSDEARKPLVDRFQRACRQISERASRAAAGSGAPGRSSDSGSGGGAGRPGGART